MQRIASKQDWRCAPDLAWGLLSHEHVGRTEDAALGMAWQLAAESSSQYQVASVSYTKASILVPT